MKEEFSRKNRSHYLWIILVVTTFVACSALVCIILTFEDEMHLPKSLESPIRAGKLTDESCIDICNTKECILHANFLLNNMNTSVDPCDDFYSFACGRIGDRFSKDEHYSFGHRHTFGMFTKVEAILDHMEPVSGSALEKMKIVYDSCTNRGYETNAVATALKFLDGIGIPDWPNLAVNFRFSDSDLTFLLGSLIAHNKKIVVAIKNEHLDKTLNSFKAAMRISDNVYTIRSSRLLVHRILKYFSLEVETVEKIWNDANAVEIAIEDLQRESYISSDGNSTDIYVDCSNADETKWGSACGILNVYLDTVANSPTNERLAVIRVYEAHFMKNIFSTFRNVSSKSVAHYIALRFFLEHMQDLSFYFRRKNPINTSIRGRKILIMEHDYCIQWIMKNLQHILAYEYILKVLTEPSLKEVQDIVDETIQETINSIRHQSWISDDFREKLITELSNTSTSIEGMKQNLNETFINQYYEEFQPTEENFFLNVLRYGKYIKRRILSGNFEEKGAEYMNPIFSVNAEAGFKEIDIGLGLLQPSLFSYGLHKSINLVSFGQLMAHEIAHEVQISYEDLFTNYNISLQDNSTLQKFLERKSCFESQFSNFKYDLIDAEVNLFMTGDENMADSLSTIFIDKMIEKYGTSIELMLPYLPYSKAQLLYISSMQLYCENMTKDVQEFYSKQATHSINRFRVLAMMQNSKGFSKTFSCPNGTYMNPLNKCLLFDFLNSE